MRTISKWITAGTLAAAAPLGLLSLSAAGASASTATSAPPAGQHQVVRHQEHGHWVTKVVQVRTYHPGRWVYNKHLHKRVYHEGYYTTRYKVIKVYVPSNDTRHHQPAPVQQHNGHGR